MRFILKIFVFVALLVAGKLTREENEAKAQESPATKTILTSYEKNDKETVEKLKVEEKKTKKLASSL